MSERRSLTWNDIENLEVDEDTPELFWKGDPLVTEQRVRLEFWTNLAVIVTGLSTAVLAATAVIRLVG